MILSNDCPLKDLDETSLYQMLGTAWYAQFKAGPSESHYLGNPVETGIEQFRILRAKLDAQNVRIDGQTEDDSVNRTIRQLADWRMPAPVVRALFHKVAMAPPRELIASRLNQSNEQKANWYVK
jgi:hypothetical protein